MNKTLKSALRRVVPKGVVSALRTAVGVPLTKWRVHKLTKAAAPIKLEVGSGPHKRFDWVTLDLSLTSDLYWDLAWGLPLPDKSVQSIYSSHVLEHFDHQGVIRLLQECCRVLKRGGEISVSVPDARLFVMGYLDPEAFDRQLMGYAPAVNSNARMDILNYIAYMDGHHKHMFDAEHLIDVLSQAGFVNVRLRDFDSSLDPLSRQKQSIYACATRP